MSAFPKPESPPERPSQRRTQTAAFLMRVLRPERVDYERAGLSSADAFRLLDQWLDLRCEEVLGDPPQMRVPVVAAGSDREYPLAQLLMTSARGEQWTGLPVVKALLLVGYVADRPELQVLVTLAKGALKAARQNSWQKLMPGAISSAVSMADAIRHCRIHADLRLAPQAGVRTEEREWLQALKRWCEILVSPQAGLVLTRAKLPPVLEVAPEHDSDTDDQIPFASDFLDEDNDGAPDSLLVDDSWLPASLAPEAPATTRRARAKTEGEPETVEGGEARRARTGFRSALENQHLPLVNHQLSEYDRHDLVVEMKGQLKADRADAAKIQDSVGLLAIAHVTGQLVEQVAEISRTPQRSASYLDGAGILMRWVPPQADAWVPKDEDLKGLRAKATHLRLQLPVEISDWLGLRLAAATGQTLGEALDLPGEIAVRHVRDWLTGVRAKSNGMQTLGRVELWLTSALYQLRPDHVPLHLICAISDGQPCPSAYYRAYPSLQLHHLHRDALVGAGWTIPPLAEPCNEIADGWVGSNLNPDFDDVKALWETTTSHFERIVADTSKPLHVRHNAREFHEVMSQMFQTFHRTVSDPMESLEFIDLQLRRLVIDDKSQGETRAHRVVPLATLATSQCREQIEHVKSLSVYLELMAPETSRQLASLIERPAWRCAPFRFLLDEKNEILRFTPSALLAALKGVWNRPLNLARHFGSTWLLERQATDAALCALLGHQDLGTQDLSLLSPHAFDSLFAALVPKLDELVEALGMRSIPSFLPPVRQLKTLPSPGTRPAEMLFGHKRRAAARMQRYLAIRNEADQWIGEQLGDRAPQLITQEDVALLFDRVRRASPNRRNHWACERFEAMREQLVKILDEHEQLKLELPAVALVVKDVAHICPMDFLAASAWLRSLRLQLAAFWQLEFRTWRSARTLAYAANPESIILTLIIESLVIDPDVWKCWAAGSRTMTLVLDESSSAWIRFGLPSQNTRLYPIQRDTAELVSGIAPERWQQVDLDDVVLFSNRLALPLEVPEVANFWQLLNRVQSGSSADIPGLVLGFADGSHGAVSPETMCLERAAGDAPTVASVEAWKKVKQAWKDSTAEARSGLGRPGQSGSYSDVAKFRRTMSEAFGKLERRRPDEPKAVDTQAKSSSVIDVGVGTPDTGEKPKTRRALGPLKRFIDFLEQRWDDLAGSPRLPPTCGLTARWILSLAKEGQSPDQENVEEYAPKTLKNYWYSWGLRFIEEFDVIDPVLLSPAEFEELYLQIVEDAKVKNRQHLYAPMRNLHRYLVKHGGASEIDWHELWQATGQGLTHIDANLVHQHEYLRALDLLINDGAVSPRVRAMQAAALVLLYRGGLRIAECLGLRDSDVVFDEMKKRWRVKVRGNLYRSLKTDSARRLVLILEALHPIETRALDGWAEHVRTFASARDIRPLFALAAGGAQGSELFPRRVIALRIAQALRLATGDPSTRIHHCRHTYASRILSLGLDDLATNGSSRQANGECAKLIEVVRELLTSEPDATRRLVWAVAVMLGHASPMTTLETYFHAGHLLLRQWCIKKTWVCHFQDERAEWIAFTCGVTVRTMQRAFERARQAGDDHRQPEEGEVRISSMVAKRSLAEIAQNTWTRIPVLGKGRRVKLGKSLPPILLVDPSNVLVSSDRIIDHARKFGRVDGLAERLFVTESWIEHVLLAARQFADARRTRKTPVEQWWIEGADMSFPEHEESQVHRALEKLASFDSAKLDGASAIVSRYLVPSARMVVIEGESELRQMVELTRHVVDDPVHIQMLIPVNLPRRLPPEQRKARDDEARRIAVLNNTPHKRSKPRRSYDSVISFEGSDAVQELAHSLGISTRPHGRVSGARDKAHSWVDPSERFGLRVRENAVDAIRSAKVYARLLASMAVARAAAQRAEHDVDSSTAG